tara:strand:+ start:107 stop:439 length:333 start_codon:yes stop_codon:yes gene_type:complete
MAFVSESYRDNTFIAKSTTGPLGPGEYFNEGLMHKQAMDAIYPKKNVPFNSQIERNESMGEIWRKFNFSFYFVQLITNNLISLISQRDSRTWSLSNQVRLRNQLIYQGNG